MRILNLHFNLELEIPNLLEEVWKFKKLQKSPKPSEWAIVHPNRAVRASSKK